MLSATYADFHIEVLYAECLYAECYGATDQTFYMSWQLILFLTKLARFIWQKNDKKIDL
jgi:hypothetical protein